MHLVTSYCNPQHCFELLRPPTTTESSTNSHGNHDTSRTTTGSYYPYLKIFGAWIPSHVFHHQGKAIMSTLRLLYLAYCVIHDRHMSQADLIVVDVLPTPLWMLYYACPHASLLYYCHFPDQLLTRPTTTTTTATTTTTNTTFKSTLIQWYRRILNAWEEQCMMYADTITVNSKFTQQTVRDTFPSLQQVPLPILYPALEVPPPLPEETSTTTTTTSPQQSPTNNKRTNLIVSLNRFERKKNLGLLIEAMAWIQQQQLPQNATQNLLSDVQVIIAGGYDPQNIENIEYRIELQQLAERLQVQHMIQFRHSISDTERNELLQTATMVVYTPSHEHFGIVPLEAMYAHTPVIACHNGGPVETIQPNHTGYLCAPTPTSFGTAILELLSDPVRAIQMGHNGHDHVRQQFSPQHLAQQWEQLVTETLQKGQERRRRRQEQQALSIYRVISPRTLLYLFESIFVLLFVIGITYLLQYASVLKHGQSLLSGTRELFMRNRDEL